MPKRCRVEKKALMEIFARNRDKLVIPGFFRIASKSSPIWLKISEDLKYAVSPANAHAIANRMNFPKLASENARSPELLVDRRAKPHPSWKKVYQALIRRRNTVLVTKPPALVPLNDPVWASIADEIDNVYTVKTLRFMAAYEPALRRLLLADAQPANLSVVKLETNDELTSSEAVSKLLRTTDTLAADVKFLKKTEKFSRKILTEIRNLRFELLQKNY